MCRNEDFIKEIFHYFVNDPSKYTTNNVIKRHTEKLAEFGDYSFPVNIQNWAQFLPSLQHLSADNIFCYREQRCNQIFESIPDHINYFVQNSQRWALQIERAVIKENRCAIFLNRFNAFQSTVNAVLNNPNYGLYEGAQSYVVRKRDDDAGDTETLNRYRCRVIENVIYNSTRHLKGSPTKEINVTHRSTDRCTPEGCTVIFVGNCTGAGNKVLHVDAGSYIQKRSVDMQLMAQHKYGLRVKNEEFFQHLVHCLGTAAVTIDLLEVKPSCSVKLTMSGCSTPPLESVDLTLFKEEVEWTLLFNYVLAYPSLITQTIGENHKSTFSLHLLCMSTFSIYYARTRILTALHARIYLLKSIQIVLNKCLALFNIDPVTQM